MGTTEEKLRNEIRLGVRRHRGALTEITNKTGLSREFVRLVLKGQRKSDRVLNIAAEVVEERETQRTKLLSSTKKHMENVAAMAGSV